MSTALQGRMAIRARQVKPGEAYAVEVKAGQFIQITDVAGKQVADFVAFNATNRAEHLSVAATRTVGSSIMLQLGMDLVSNRRNPMFELVEDTVGRHDILLALCDQPASDVPIEPVAETPTDAPPTDDSAPTTDSDADSGDVGVEPHRSASTEAEEDAKIDAVSTEDATPEAKSDPSPQEETKPLPTLALGCRAALGHALEPFGIAADQVPDPINWFMNVGIKGRGEIEIREPLSERNDYVVLVARMDAIVAVTACSQADDATNGNNPTDILVRIYR